VPERPWLAACGRGLKAWPISLCVQHFGAST
jgi:hypothetical protein